MYPSRQAERALREEEQGGQLEQILSAVEKGKSKATGEDGKGS